MRPGRNRYFCITRMAVNHKKPHDVQVNRHKPMKYMIKAGNVLVSNYRDKNIAFCGKVTESNEECLFVDEEEPLRVNKEEAKKIIASFFPDKSFREMVVPVTGYICYMWGPDQWALKSRRYETLREFRTRIKLCGFSEYRLEFSEWEEL